MFGRFYNSFFNRSIIKMAATTVNPEMLKTFFEAVDSGNIDSTVEMLKLKKIDVNTRNKDEFNQTPLHVASKNGYVDIVQTLIDDYKADINSRDINGDTPMKVAVDNGQVEVVIFLETKKPKDVDYAKRILNDEVVDELFEAAETNNIQKVVEILDKKKIDVNVSDKAQYHRTILNAAAYNGHLDLVKLLIEKYDADINWSDEIGDFSIHMAADNGHYEVTKYLADQGSMGANDVAEYLARKGDAET